MRVTSSAQVEKIHRMGEANKSNLLWLVIPAVLAGMPMPFIHPERRMNGGGVLDAFDDELKDLHLAGVRAVVSLLYIPADAAVYESAGFAFLCLPVPDGHPPTMDQASHFFRCVAEQTAARGPVAVHCGAGLGRTGTMLAVPLISRGESVESAICRIRMIEPGAVETPHQIGFLEKFAAGT